MVPVYRWPGGRTVNTPLGGVYVMTPVMSGRSKHLTAQLQGNNNGT